MMQLLDLIRFGLLLTGLTYILTKSTIFGMVRIPLLVLFRKLPLGSWFAVLLYCPACASFWFGVALARAHLWPLQHVLWGHLDAAISSCGFIAVVMNDVASDVWIHEEAQVRRFLGLDPVEPTTEDQPRDKT